MRPSCPLLKGKGLSPSSKAWLARQYRDPYVKQRLSHPASYRSRSAFKLLEIDERWGGFLSKDYVTSVVDLGAAPGGWSQVVAGKLGWAEEPKANANASLPWEDVGDDPNDNININGDDFESLAISTDGTETGSVPGKQPKVKGRGTIVAVDLLPLAPIPGVRTLRGDVLAPDTAALVRALLVSPANPQGSADVVLSDMAPNLTGNRIHDVEASLALCSAVFEFAAGHFSGAGAAKSAGTGKSGGGVLLMKHFMHPLLQNFRKERLEPNFKTVYFIKPDASRASSSEGYWLCRGWKGVR